MISDVCTATFGCVMPDSSPNISDWFEVFGDMATCQEINDACEDFWSNTEVARFVYTEMPDGSWLLVDTVRTDTPREKPTSFFDEVNARRRENTRKN